MEAPWKPLKREKYMVKKREGVCVYNFFGRPGSGSGSGPTSGSGPGPDNAAAQCAAAADGLGLDPDPGLGPGIFELSGRPRCSVPDNSSR